MGEGEGVGAVTPEGVQEADPRWRVWGEAPPLEAEVLALSV